MFRELMDEFEAALFLQRPGADWKIPLVFVDIPIIETKIEGQFQNWICGFCGRSNSLGVHLCRSCGAPPKRALHQGYARLESWLPVGDFLYSLSSDFTLYINRITCGRRDEFREEEVVFKLEHCIAGPVQATSVVRGCRDEGDLPETVRLCCEVSCKCVYVGAPWQEPA